MTAMAIWWSVDKQTMRARGVEGTAMFSVDRCRRIHRSEEPGLLWFKHSDGRRWSEDDANPRRVSLNTLTLTKARRFIGDMVEAVRQRLVEAADLYKVDPSMHDLYAEQSSARYVHAVEDVRVYLATHYDPRDWIKDANSVGKLSDSIRRAAAHDDDCERRVNPWLSDASSRMPNSDWGGARERSDARILFVLFGVEPKKETT